MALDKLLNFRYSMAVEMGEQVLQLYSSPAVALKLVSFSLVYPSHISAVCLLKVNCILLGIAGLV